MSPGIYDIAAELYHADPCPEPSLSASVAQLLLEKSPAHAREAHPKLNPDFKADHNANFDLGKAAHAIFLEADRSTIEVIDATSYQTKAAKAARDAAYAAGKTPLKIDDYEKAEAICQAIRAQIEHHPEAAEAFDGGAAEMTWAWKDQGMWCRARPDWTTTRGDVWDLKISGIDGPNAWQRHAFDMNYDLRAGFYRRGMANFGHTGNKYYFLVADAKPPHAIFVAGFTPAALAMADAKAHWAVTVWRWCIENNRWPGYPSQTIYVDPPPWVGARWEEAKERLADPDYYKRMIEWQAPLEETSS